MLRRARPSNRVSSVPAESGPSAQVTKVTARTMRRRLRGTRGDARRWTRPQQARGHGARPGHGAGGPLDLCLCGPDPRGKLLQLRVVPLDVRDDVIQHSVLRLEMRLELQAFAEDCLC